MKETWNADSSGKKPPPSDTNSPLKQQTTGENEKLHDAVGGS